MNEGRTLIDERLAAWTTAGLIDDGQARAIRGFEDERGSDGEQVRSHVAASLGTLGGVLVGLGVLLTVAANWESIGDTAKLITIVIAMLSAYASALEAERRQAPRWVATAGYTVGVLVFAGGVFLLGQVYNVRAHDPLGFLVVALVASSVAVVAGRTLVGWIAGAAWLAWAMHEVVLSLEGTSDDRAQLTIAAAAVLLGIAGLGSSWVLDGLASRASRGDEASEGATLLADLEHVGGPLRGVALAGLLGALVPLSFIWRIDDELSGVGTMSLALVAAALAALGAAALAAWLAPLGQRRVLGLVLVAAALGTIGAASLESLVFAGIGANVLFIGGGVGLAALGLMERSRATYAWGVAWIVAAVGSRYIDAMVSLNLGGVGFIGVGVLLIGCAWLVGRSRSIWQEGEAA